LRGTGRRKKHERGAGQDECPDLHGRHDAPDVFGGQEYR
jgi:hypothetical protein